MWNDDDLLEMIGTWYFGKGIIELFMYAFLVFIGLIIGVIYLIYMAIVCRKEIKEAFINVKNKIVKIFEKLKEKKGGLAADSSD